jgi:hypothetical protein
MTTNWRCLMSDQPTLYQPFQPPPEIYPLSELRGAICYDVASAQPQNPNCPKGEWYCQNPWCVVREVTVFCKLRGEALPDMRCPGCRKRLKFHHWLATEALVPCRDTAPTSQT